MSSKNKLDFMISHLTIEDVPSTVNLHCQVFPDYFLTHMGQNFLQRFYQEFITYPGHGLVAKYNGQVVGFVTGTTEPDSFYNQFYRRNFSALMLLVIARFLSDNYIRQNIWSRVVHFRHALAARLRYRQKRNLANATVPTPFPQVAHLLSIGVAEEYRGSGIAETLSEHFCTELKQVGIQTVYLSVLPDNKRAIRFYEKSGWLLAESEGGSLLFFKSIVH